MKNKVKIAFSTIMLAILLTSFVASLTNPKDSDQRLFNIPPVDGSDVYDINYIIGDVDGNRVIDNSDIDYLIAYLYKGGPAPDPIESGDFNEDGQVNLGDVVAMVNYLKENGLLDSDEESPEITLLAPDNNEEFKTSKDEKEIEFEYKVSDDSEIDYCELIIDGDVEDNNWNIERDMINYFERELDSNEEYDWKIKCVDVYGNVGFSEEWDFEIKEKEETKDDYFSLTDNSNKEETYDFTLPKEPIVLNSQEKEPKAYNISFSIILPIILAFSILVMLVIMGVVVKR